MPIRAPKILGSEPLNAMVIIETPKRHILGRNRAYIAILVEIGQAVRPGRETKKPKKQGKKLTVANWVFAQTTHVDAAICGLAGWSSRGSYKFQVSLKSVEQFSRCGGGSKFAIFL